MSDFKNLYSIAKPIANHAKNEFGSGFIGFQKLKKLTSQDHFLQLLLSKVNYQVDKIKILYIVYYILNMPFNEDEIKNIINNLYVLSVDLYEDKNRIDVECDECDGTGEQNCRECRGDGSVDCRYCDGDGNIECYDCYGDGTEECRCCDGNGTETEEDDEGEEIEVSCSCCDGKGTEDCRSCGGQGSFGCDECGSRGTQKCDECSGYGQVSCTYCYEGYQESSEEYYKVEKRSIVMYGTNAQEYVGKIMTIDDYSKIEYDENIFDYEFQLKSRYYQEEENDVDETRSEYEMDDDFVKIKDLEKLENFGGSLLF